MTLTRLPDLSDRLEAAAAAEQAEQSARRETELDRAFTTHQDKIVLERARLTTALSEAGLRPGDFHLCEAHHGPDLEAQHNAHVHFSRPDIDVYALVQVAGTPVALCRDQYRLGVLAVQPDDTVRLDSCPPAALFLHLHHNRAKLVLPEQVLNWYDEDTEEQGMVLRGKADDFASARPVFASPPMAMPYRAEQIEPFADALARQRFNDDHYAWAKVKIVAALLANPARSLEPADAVSTAEAVMVELIESVR